MAPAAEHGLSPEQVGCTHFGCLSRPLRAPCARSHAFHFFVMHRSRNSKSCSIRWTTTAEGTLMLRSFQVGYAMKMYVALLRTRAVTEPARHDRARCVSHASSARLDVLRYACRQSCSTTWG